MCKRQVFKVYVEILFLVFFFSIVSANTTQYIYDDLNRLIKVEYESGVQIEYTYDSSGNRLSRSIKTSDDVDQNIIVLTESSPDTTIAAIDNFITVYGTMAANHVTLESGAKAELLNFPGNNEITIKSDSENFTVFRSGAVLTVNGEDGTILKFPATINTQTLLFNDISLDCLIQDGQVMLGGKAIGTTPVPVSGDSTKNTLGWIRTANINRQNQYALEFYVIDLVKDDTSILSATISGPVTGTINVESDGAKCHYIHWFDPDETPLINEKYAIKAIYSDGSVDTVTAIIRETHVGRAIPTFPVDDDIISSFTPTFTWQAPSCNCQGYYRVWVVDSEDNDVWSVYLSKETTSVVYNFDGKGKKLENGKTYEWRLLSFDEPVEGWGDNYAQIITFFTVQNVEEATIFNFNDGMGDDFFFSDPTGLFSYDDTQGNIQISKPTDTMTEDDVKYAKLYSNFSIEGDFDISVEYKLNTVLQDGDQLEFQVFNASFSFFVVRSNETWIGGNNYHVYSNDNIGPQPGIITDDDHGNMRIVRSGSVITGYAKQFDEAQYEEIYSFTLNDDPVQLALSIQNQPHSHSSLDVEFDNLTITDNISSDIICDSNDSSMWGCMVWGQDLWGTESNIELYDFNISGESGLGDGQIMSRSNAYNQSTLWLHSNESRNYTFQLSQASRFNIKIRYGNDNFGETERIKVFIDGVSVGEIESRDTGNECSEVACGWNEFYEDMLENIGIESGEHDLTLTISGGDEYGIEIDHLFFEVAQ